MESILRAREAFNSTLRMIPKYIQKMYLKIDKK